MKFWYALLVFVPVAVVAELLGAEPLLIFVFSALAILPLSTLLGDATDRAVTLLTIPLSVSTVLFV